MVALHDFAQTNYPQIAPIRRSGRGQKRVQHVAAQLVCCRLPVVRVLMVVLSVRRPSSLPFLGTHAAMRLVLAPVA